MTPIHLPRPISIRLPYPPKELWPNGGRSWHYAKLNRIAQEYKKTCGKLILPHRAQLKVCKSREVYITALPKPRGPHPDRDNVDASLKYAFDALAEMWGINDREIIPQPVEFGERVRGGAIILEVRE